MAAPAAAPVTAAQLTDQINRLKGNALVFKGREGEDPAAFKNKMLLLFREKNITDDDKKLQEWLKHLGGRAVTWAAPFFDDLLNPPATGRILTLADFQNRFNNTFAYQNLQENAKRQLDALRQGSKSMNNYIQQFQELQYHTGYGEPELKQRFLNGLDGKIRYDITLMGQDDTLEHAMEAAQRLYCLWQNPKDAYDDPGRNPRARSSDDDHGYAPMELDATKSRSTSPNTKCYNCRRLGHISCNCKAPRCNSRGRGRGRIYTPPRGFRARATNTELLDLSELEEKLAQQQDALEIMSKLVTAISDKNQAEHVKDF